MLSNEPQIPEFSHILKFIIWYFLPQISQNLICPIEKKFQKSEFSYWNNLRNLNLPNGSNSDILWNMHQILGHLKGRRRTHNIEKLFPYYQCKKLFSFACSLKTHMHRTYTWVKLFHCYQCPKIFSRDHHLKNHRKTQTGGTEAISLWSMH